ATQSANTATYAWIKRLVLKEIFCMDADSQNVNDEPQATAEPLTECLEPPGAKQPPPDAGDSQHAEVECPEAPQPDSCRADVILEARRQRIMEHRGLGTMHGDSLLACVACLNSDVFEFELAFAEKLRQLMAQTEASASDMEACSELLEVILRLAKQNAQL